MAYKLTLQKEHLRPLIEALDLYSRLQAGQVEELRHFFYDRHLSRLEIEDSDRLRHLADQIKRIVFPDLPINGSHGIRSPETPRPAKLAYDIIQVVRRKIAAEEKHPDWSVWHHQPMQTGEVPLPEIEETGP